MTTKDYIQHLTGHTPDEIRNMDDDALWELIAKVHNEGFEEGYDA